MALRMMIDKNIHLFPCTYVRNVLYSLTFGSGPIGTGTEWFWHLRKKVAKRKDFSFRANACQRQALCLLYLCLQ